MCLCSLDRHVLANPAEDMFVMVVTIVKILSKNKGNCSKVELLFFFRGKSDPEHNLIDNIVLVPSATRFAGSFEERTGNN